MQMISGKIEKGEGLGSKISFPTINIVVEKDEKLRGVYVCEVSLEDGTDDRSEMVGDKSIGDVGVISLEGKADLKSRTVFFGASYVGEKAILPADKYICEVFLFGEAGCDSGDWVVFTTDFGDLYGKFVEVKLLKKIRDVQKTKNLEELKTLISSDVSFAKEYVKNYDISGGDDGCVGGG